VASLPSTTARAADRRAARAGREPYEFRLGHLPVYFLLLVGAVVSVTPFFYMASTSLMTLGETINRRVLPATPQWGNYQRAWTEADFALYFRNSVVITSIVILGVLVLSLIHI